MQVSISRGKYLTCLGILYMPLLVCLFFEDQDAVVLCCWCPPVTL